MRFTFNVMLWLQSSFSLRSEGRAYGISPAKSSVHEGIYLFPEFKHQKHFFFPPQRVTFHLSFIWTCLVRIGFVKYITKSLYLKFRSFQTVCNLIGQRRPLLSLGFLPPELAYHRPSSCLQSSSRIIASCWQKAGSAETAGHNCWKGPLSIQHSF